MPSNHDERIHTEELIPNIRAWSHTANAVELPDGRLFLVWSAGQFEESEDMVVAGAVREVDGTWQPSRVVVDRFDMDGETWIPWCPIILQAADGDLHVFCMGNPRSKYVYVDQPRSLVRAGWQLGDDADNRMLHVRLKDFAADHARIVLPDEGGVNTQGTPLHLESGGWIVPFDNMHTRHCHFLHLDEKLESYENRGDLDIDPGVLEPSIVQLGDGRILCYLRFWPSWNWGKAVKGEAIQGHVVKTVSDDDCRTFSAPVVTNLRNPNSGVDIKVSRSGKLLITYNDSYALRLPLCVGISNDMGKTFRVRDVETGLSEPHYGWSFANYMYNCHAYPKLLQTRDNTWHLFYTHRYDCIKHVWFDESWLEGGRLVAGLDE